MLFLKFFIFCALSCVYFHLCHSSFFITLFSLWPPVLGWCRLVRSSVAASLRSCRSRSNARVLTTSKTITGELSHHLLKEKFSWNPGHRTPQKLHSELLVVSKLAGVFPLHIIYLRWCRSNTNSPQYYSFHFKFNVKVSKSL